MTINKSLKTALGKVNPRIEGEILLLTSPQTEAKLNASSFIETIYEEYRSLIEYEIEEKWTITFETDFAGCEKGFDDFVIQDTENVDEKGRTIFGFHFFQPEKEEHELVPKSHDEYMNWDELKEWCAYLLVTAGKEKIESIEQEIRKELQQNEEASKERMKKLTAEVGELSIYPNSSIEYHSVWFSHDSGGIQIPVLAEDLEEILWFVEENGSESKRINNVYNDSNEFLMFMWKNETEINVHFHEEKNHSVVIISSENIKKLREELIKIDSNKYWI